MKYSFSNKNREHFVNQLQETEFDLLIIGGGITGAGVMLDAISRGLKVALIEKNDFASGTSSKSTKLIHGGLRYLKNYEFSLVRESARERKVIFKNAPHIVKPEKMLLPITKEGSLTKFQAWVGLTVYDFLGRVDKQDKKSMLKQAEIGVVEPSLKDLDLAGAGLYTEYRSDDARLVIELIKTAYDLGALALNYCEAQSFIIKNGKVSGINAFDSCTQKKLGIKAKHIINAAGPWVDKVCESENSHYVERLCHSKGSHIVIDRNKMKINNNIYFDGQDGRMIFAITRGSKVYIGTTDDLYEGSLDQIIVTRDEVDYLLSAVNEYFKFDLSVSDIESSWAGVRPLIQEKGKLTSEISRRDEIFISDSGLVSIAGGKLTGYRLMAKKAVDKLFPQLISQTEDIQISNGKINESSESIEALEHCYENEMIVKPLDFFERRTGKLYFNIHDVQKSKESVIAWLTSKSSYDLDQVELENSILNSYHFKKTE